MGWATVSQGAWQIDHLFLSQVPLPSGGTSSPGPGRGRGEVRLELAFEYLMSKDRLQWVTITSPQV